MDSATAPFIRFSPGGVTLRPGALKKTTQAKRHVRPR